MYLSKSYQELISIDSYEKRFDYLKLYGKVGVETFGSSRYLNQILYNSAEWKRVRRKVIIRDDAYDMAHKDYPIVDKFITVHHINPITVEDVINRNFLVFDLNNLITVSYQTHQAIHYGDKNLLILEPIKRFKNDTCPWKQ